MNLIMQHDNKKGLWKDQVIKDKKIIKFKRRYFFNYTYIYLIFEKKNIKNNTYFVCFNI